MSMDPKTRALSKRSMAVLQANGNSAPPTLLATCGIGAVDFKLVSA
jgi:hypothetical protein